MNKYILLAITALCLQDMQAQTVVHPKYKNKDYFCNCSRSEKVMMKRKVKLMLIVPV